MPKINFVAEIATLRSQRRRLDERIVFLTGWAKECGIEIPADEAPAPKKRRKLSDEHRQKISASLRKRQAPASALTEVA